MGQKKSILTNYESEEMKELKDKIDKEGPAAANKYLEKNINRWKTEEVKFAVSGSTATGKSTFINTLRGVKSGDEGYAEVGSGDTTMKPTRYVHPENPRIVYYDLPGVATSEVKKENYINSMKIADYDFIFIFFEYVITEDMLWLVGEFKKLGKPYCLVRSKMDQDIKNGERENVDSEMVIRRIRQKIEKSLEKNKSLKDAKKVFFISCVDTNIGELSELLSYVESNLDDFKGLAALASMAVLSEFIIGLKYKVLKNRIKKVSVAAAAIAAVPVPGVDVALNIALLVEEVIHYINSFGLSRKKMGTLDTFDTSRLKCTKILLPGAEMAVFVIARLGFFVTLMVAENLLDLFLPFVGSLISGATSAVITYKFLNSVLEDLRDDSIVVFKHIMQHQSKKMFSK